MATKTKPCASQRLAFFAALLAGIVGSRFRLVSTHVLLSHGRVASLGFLTHLAPLVRNGLHHLTRSTEGARCDDLRTALDSEEQVSSSRARGSSWIASAGRGGSHANAGAEWYIEGAPVQSRSSIVRLKIEGRSCTAPTTTTTTIAPATTAAAAAERAATPDTTATTTERNLMAVKLPKVLCALRERPRFAQHRLAL